MVTKSHPNYMPNVLAVIKFLDGKAQNPDKEQLIQELLPQPMRVHFVGPLSTVMISISERNQCSK